MPAARHDRSQTTPGWRSRQARRDRHRRPPRRLRACSRRELHYWRRRFGRSLRIQAPAGRYAALRDALPRQSQPPPSAPSRNSAHHPARLQVDPATATPVPQAVSLPAVPPARPGRHSKPPVRPAPARSARKSASASLSSGSPQRPSRASS